MRATRRDPDRPPTTGPGRYLWWLVMRQRRRALAGALLGSSWMIGLTLPPYLLSRAIDDGLTPGRWGALLGWCAALLGVGAVNAVLALLRHRTMTQVRMDAAFRTVDVVVDQATRLGGALPRTVAAGEVVTIGIGDVWVIGRTMTITGPGVGAVIAYLVIAALLLSVSPLLGAVVLIGVPVLAILVGPLLGRLRRAGIAYRTSQGALTGRTVDIIGGLRILNGLGGKDAHTRRYRAGSAELRGEGYRVGAVTSWVESLGVGLPAVFLAAVTWLAARLAAAGTITAGELVAVYANAAILAIPVAFFIEGGTDLIAGLVAARRVVDFLARTPDPADRGTRVAGPPGPAPLHDPESGVLVAPGRLTALTGARTAEAAAIVDRLGRFTDSAVTWGDVRLDTVALAEVRDRILVADNEADLFAGALRDVLAGRSDRDGADLARAVRAAVADDVVAGLPAGLGSPVAARGRNLSGGQRQRVRLARALLADPEVLLAVEPTSALDATTEAVIAGRLRAERAGRTTLVVTTSPLVLDRADVVYHLVDGVVAAEGTHHDLLAGDAAYRALVSRGSGEGPDEPAGGDLAEPGAEGPDEPGGGDLDEPVGRDPAGAPGRAAARRPQETVR